MAINNKTWVLNEKITSAGLNAMSQDACNTTDNIHPQYYTSGDISFDYGSEVIAQHEIRGYYVYLSGFTDIHAYSYSQCSRGGGKQDEIGGDGISGILSRAYSMTAGVVLPFKKRSFHNSISISYIDKIVSSHALDVYTGKSYYNLYNKGILIKSGNFDLATSETERSISCSISTLEDNSDLILRLWVGITSISHTGGSSFAFLVYAYLKKLIVTFS
ncbi:MAG: hypothetical protein ABIL22_04225 [candidate division WOR-3 bacterium]